MSESSFNRWNPYLAGLALGAVLTISFVLSGRGLGVSGVFSDLARSIVSPDPILPIVSEPLLFEVFGLIAGAWLSARMANRPLVSVARGPGISDSARLIWSVTGGVFVGFGSRLAHGCTSGQALSGGALLSLGSWIFMIALFASAYALAATLRRNWT